MAEGAWGQTASVLAMLYNANRGKGGQVLQPRDFNPFTPRRKPARVGVGVLKSAFKDKIASCSPSKPSDSSSTARS